MSRDHRKQAARQALNHIFPDGVDGVAAKVREKRINDYLVETGRSTVSTRLIVEIVAEQRKRKLQKL